MVDHFVSEFKRKHKKDLWNPAGSREDLKNKCFIEFFLFQRHIFKEPWTK